MINYIVGIDPGLNGGLVVIDLGGRILHAERLKDGLPAILKWNLAYDQKGPNPYHYVMKWKLRDAYFDEIIFIREAHDWRHASMRRANIKPEFAVKHEYYAGRIDQWLYERGVKQIEKVQVATWQKIYKGIHGSTPKKRAFNYLKYASPYCLERQAEPPKIGLPYCKNCSTSCELKRHGVIGPQGGYQDGPGDALLIALWRLEKYRREGK